MCDNLTSMHIRFFALALLLSATAASAASVSDFSLVDNGDGSVTLSWTVSGSSGMFYRGYNVAVSRGTSPDQAASTRTLVEGDSGSYMTQQGTTGSVRDAPPATGETYYYWLHYSNYSIINDTENFFFNYLGGSPGTILSAPCTGPRSYQSSGGGETLDAPESASAITGDTVVTVVVSWSAVDGAESYQVYAGRTDSFDAASPIQASVAGTTLSYVVPAASVNAMPDYFWVVAKKGTIESDPSPAALWTRTPQDLPVTAKPLAADVSAGSITIGWDDPGVVVPAGLTFTLYRNTVDDPSTAVSTGVSGAGPSFVDTGFGAIGGTSPVYYYILNDQGLFSPLATGKTRVRRGVFVGVCEYAPEQKLESLPESDDNARLVGSLATEKGGFDSDNVSILTTRSETTLSSIRKSIADTAEISNPGDVFFFYISTHGGADGGGLLAAFDTDYTGQQFMSDLSLFGTCVSVVCFIGACESEALYDGGWDWMERSGFAASCPVNMAFVAACNWQESAYGFPGDYDEFETFFFHYGWRHSYANYDDDGFLTLSEAVQYATGTVKGISDELASHVASQIPAALSDIVLGSCSPKPASVSPSTPTGVFATQGTVKGSVAVSWNEADNADWYRVYRYSDEIGTEDLQCLAYHRAGTIFSDKCKTASSSRNRYYIVAVNPGAVGSPSAEAVGWKKDEFRDYLVSSGRLDAAASDEQYETVANDKAANGQTLRSCFIAGLSDTDPKAELRATISMSSGAPDVRPSPDLGAARVYTVMGKTNLADEAWVTPTNASHRFFQVKVELPEE